MHERDEPGRTPGPGTRRPARDRRGGWVDGARPVRRRDVTTAAEAGWAPPGRAGRNSWVWAAGSFVDPEPEQVISLIDEATTAPTVVDGRPQGDARSATEGRVLDIDDVATGPQADDARRDAIARHPAFAGHDSEAPAVAPSPIPPADDAGADLLRRVERGAARAADEAQLRTLAVRTSHRVVPDGSVTWLAADDAGRLLTWVQTDDAEVPCGVVHASSCPAISTGTTQVVDRSDELDACPHLLGGDQPLSAVACVALPGPSPMVLLARTPAGRPCDDAALRILEHTARVLEARANELSTDA